jgi:hypothetical protein
VYAVIPYTRSLPILSAIGDLDTVHREVQEIVEKGVQLIKEGCVSVEDQEILDDCNVSVYAIPKETHVCLYMRLPVTKSIHYCLRMIRKASTKAVEQPNLYKKAVRDMPIFSKEYLVFCGALDTQPQPSLDTNNLEKLLDLFYLQNNLVIHDIDNAIHKLMNWKGPQFPGSAGNNIYERG